MSPSPGPEGQEFFPQFSDDLFLVVTLHQVHLYISVGPFTQPFLSCDTFFIPTYKASHDQWGPVSPRGGSLLPPRGSPRSGGSRLVSVDSCQFRAGLTIRGPIPT